MRRSMIVLAGIVALLAVAAFVVLREPAGEAVGRAGSTEATAPSGAASRLSARVVQSGEVLVTIEPMRLDRRGAVFQIAFETHSVELSLDVAAGAALDVDGVAWSNATWAGTPPGGHHREGELTFEPAGVARGKAVLRIGGLPEPVVASWTLGG